jgi:hypothetical protein
MKKFLRIPFSNKKSHDSTPETGSFVIDAHDNSTLPAPTAVAYPIGCETLFEGTTPITAE